MKHFATRLAALCALFFITTHSASAQRTFWRAATGAPTHTAPATAYRTLRYDLSALRAAVPRPDAAARGGDASRTLSLPMPDGGELTATVEPAAVLEAGLQAANPGIQTFRGTTQDGASLRLTVTDYGVWARIQLADGRTVYIQPLTPANTAWSAVYFSEDAERGAAHCGVEGGAPIDEDAPAGKTAAYSYTDATLRNYKLSVAATGEYTVANGGQAGALSAIAATVSNVTLIFERDLGVTFTLYSPDTILFTNPATDPYTTTLNTQTLDTNRVELTARLGAGAYDIGHVFSTAFGGGLAYGNVVCNTSYKGGGASGAVNASQASFEEVVAHEFGHQFSASHTFSASTNSCNGNGFYPAGWEPGSGTSIMSYADLCSPLNVPGGKGRFFHAGSLQQMGNYILNSTGSICPTTSTPANPAPTIATTTAITIPHSTPFRLTSTGADANNPTTLTYTYDQLDAIGGSGTASLPDPASATGPLFRSYVPGASPTRYFPPLAALFAGTATPYEVLPSVARTINFRATVRDNNPSFGRTQTESVVVTTASCGPFEITSQNTATSLTADGTSQMTVTWNTASACVTCPNVTLRITRDGGATYTTLLASTPNDGTETFLVPNVPACDARLMLECSTVPFFDVTSAPLTISSSCAADGSQISPSTTLSVPAPGDAALAQMLTPGYGTAIATPITGSITTADPGGNTSVFDANTNACITFSNQMHYDVYTFTPGTTGSYTFDGMGNPFGLVYNLYEGAYNPAFPCERFLASSATLTAFTSPGNTVTANLCRDKQYTLLVSSFSPSLPTLPASYSISVTGGTLYSNGTPAPGAGYTYEYVIVNNTTGNIVAIQATADMTNTTLFPDGQYSVYGLSRGTSTSAASYVGGSFAAFQTAVLGQSGGLCASLSANSRTVLINSTPLAGLDVRLTAALTDRRTARAAWSVQGSEAGVARYELQRSYDGRLFAAAATTLPGTGVQHTATDAGLREDAAGVHYRVAIYTVGGTPRYTATTYLPFATGAAAPALTVVPNPVQGATLRAVVTSAAAGTGTAIVLDAAGRAVLRMPVSLSLGAQGLELPTGSLAAGVYLLRVEGAGAPLQVRFVKSK